MSHASRVSLFTYATYRLWRCKRLLVFVPVMVMLGGLFAGQFGGLSSYYFELEEVLKAGAIAFGCTAIAVILLPGAPLEVLFGGLAAALLVATEPWQGMIFQPADKGGDFTPLWLKCVIFLTAGLVIMSISYAVVMAVAAKLPTRSRPLSYRLFVRGGDAAGLRRILSLRPNSTSGPVTYESMGWDGFVPAKIFVRTHDPVDFAITDTHHKFSVKALHSNGDTDTFLIRDDIGVREVSNTFRAAPKGAWVEVEERPGPPGPLVGLSLMLNEGGPDLIRARVDYHLGRPSPAFLLRPMRSFLCAIARLTHIPGPKSQHPAE